MVLPDVLVVVVVVGWMMGGGGGGDGVRGFTGADNGEVTR